MVTFTEPFRATFRVTSLLSCEEEPSYVVVATDPVSANADHDNGVTLQHQACAGLRRPRRNILVRALLKSLVRALDASHLPLPGFHTVRTEVP